jgi:pyrophosphatase PpaX
MTTAAVLFDLDGTILDTNELIIRSFLHALRGVVPPEFGREHIIPHMGKPLEEQLRYFSGRDEVDDLHTAYREYNWREHDALVTAFPHVAEVLERLKAAGFKIGVVTTKMRVTSMRGMKHVGIDGFVDALVAFDDVEHAKPHPEPVLRALELLDVRPEEALMVGDSPADMQSALAAGAVPVGVAWSLKGERVLLDAGARHIIRDMRDLYELTGLERNTP